MDKWTNEQVLLMLKGILSPSGWANASAKMVEITTAKTNEYIEEINILKLKILKKYNQCNVYEQF